MQCHLRATVVRYIEMPVIRRPESPFFHVEFEFKGKRYRRSAKTKSRRVAEHFERQLRQQVYDQIMLGIRSPTCMTLDAAIERYRKVHLGAVVRREKTAQAMEYMLARLIKLLGGETVLNEITTPVVADLKERLLSGGAKAATVNRYLANLRAVLRMAHLEWGVLDRVPRFKLYTLRNERTRWLTEDEEQRLLVACEAQPHLHDLVVFLLDTGCRLGEALDLEWQHITLRNDGCGVVRILRSKSGRPRSVPLARRADALLRRLSAVRPEQCHRIFVMRSCGTAWRGTTARAVPFSNPYGAWKTATRRAGLKDVRMHDLRHTFASRLIQRDVPLPTVSRLLGHESLRMTMRYAHLAVTDLERGVEALNR